jgi:hypothetical protein
MFTLPLAITERLHLSPKLLFLLLNYNLSNYYYYYSKKVGYYEKNIGTQIIGWGLHKQAQSNQKKKRKNHLCL